MNKKIILLGAISVLAVGGIFYAYRLNASEQCVPGSGACCKAGQTQTTAAATTDKSCCAPSEKK